jgi:hypothetical protein
VVEGATFRQLRREQAGDDLSDSGSGATSSSEGAEEDEPSKELGKTYRVRGGKVKELARGMVQYVELVERKLAKQRK